MVTEHGFADRDEADDRAADVESDQRRGRFVDPRLAQSTIDEWRLRPKPADKSAQDILVLFYGSGGKRWTRG